MSQINSLYSGSLWLKLQINSNSTNFGANWGRTWQVYLDCTSYFWLLLPIQKCHHISLIGR